MKLICIKCPRGCELTIENENITGNMCPRGIEYAREEMTCPKRTVTYLAKSSYGVVPVKTTNEIPKDQINRVIDEISKLNLQEVSIGDIVISNILGLDCDVIVTGSPYKK